MVGTRMTSWIPASAGMTSWIPLIRDHIAGSVRIETDDFELSPFSKEGGLGKVHQLFGDKLNAIIEELNGTLAA